MLSEGSDLYFGAVTECLVDKEKESGKEKSALQNSSNSQEQAAMGIKQGQEIRCE